MSDYLSPDPVKPPPTQPSRRRGKRFWILLVVGCLLAIGGSATGVALYLDHRADVRAEAAADRREAAEKAAAEAEEREREAAAAEAAQKAQEEYDGCVRELDPLLNALSEVDARLDVGLSYDEYSDKVGDASVAYSRIAFRELEPDCVSRVGVALENALNKYSAVASDWNDCIYDVYCSDSDLDDRLQPRWAAASRLISRADEQLDSLDPAKSGTES